MSALQETGHERRKEVGPLLLVQNNTKNSLFKKGIEEGIVERLTTGQLEIFKRRGYFNEGPLVPFRQLDLSDLGITWQAAQNREKRAFRRLERRGLKITLEEKEFLQENPDLPVTQASMQLRHAYQTIVRWKDWLGMPRRPEGRPRKQT